MRYVGDIYRPPSEAYSLLVQVTIGCSHNKCTFCSMFKAKQFYVRKIEEVMEDLEDARRTYRRIDRIFLCDGDALCLSNRRLLPILEKIKTLFPECRRVGVYARATDILRKTEEELLELKAAGLGILYVGAESGSAKILEKINKGETREELITGVKKAEELGIPTSVTFISGMGGTENWEEHAIETGKMITEMSPSYASLLTLMVEPGTELYDEIARGDFNVPSAGDIVKETYLLLQHTNPTRDCVFRSNHASNYISLKGDLPKDRDHMLTQLEAAMRGERMLKDERFRML